MHGPVLDALPGRRYLSIEMAPRSFPRGASSLAELHYVRPVEPIDFPEEEEMPEGYAHLVLRTFLFRLLSFALGPGHTVASDQFVFWDASSSARRLAPDVFVRLDHPQPERLGAWQTWRDGGAPDLAVEIVSPNEGDGIAWDEKLARYHQLGIRELVRFDTQAPEGQRLRVWDRVNGDLVERRRDGDVGSRCATLGLVWTVRAILGPNGSSEFTGLRLVDGEGRLLETPEEAEGRARAQAEARAQAAEARIRELEEQLRRASGGG